MQTKKKSKNVWKSIWTDHWATIVGTVVAAIAVISIWRIGVCRTGMDWSGQMESLFSALALVGVVATLVLQSRELALQRRELKVTRAELKKQAIAQTKMEQAAQKQAKNLLASAYLNATSSYLAAAREPVETGAIGKTELLQMLSRMLLNLQPELEDIFSAYATRPRAVAEISTKLRDLVDRMNKLEKNTPVTQDPCFIDSSQLQSIRGEFYQATCNVFDQGLMELMDWAELESIKTSLGTNASAMVTKDAMRIAVQRLETWLVNATAEAEEWINIE